MDSLKSVLKEELQKYVAGGANCRSFPLFDDEHQTYAVNVVDYPVRKQAGDLVIFARIEGNHILIEDDFSDKPLVDALLQRGVDRHNIVLIYAGEPYPEPITHSN